MDENQEAINVKSRYKKRNNNYNYSFNRPEVQYSHQERIRKTISILNKIFKDNLYSNLKLIEIGSGAGYNLLDFIRIGFTPENLSGVELITSRFEIARSILPRSVRLDCADALSIDYGNMQYDIVFQSVVFSSLLDDRYQNQLAKMMWSIVRPGGIILWYDFIYNNPRNNDVRGVKVNRIKELFPFGKFYSQSLTLAPPISRFLCNLHPALYPIFNSLIFLRTHRLIAIKKEK